MTLFVRTWLSAYVPSQLTHHIHNRLLHIPTCIVRLSISMFNVRVADLLLLWYNVNVWYTIHFEFQHYVHTLQIPNVAMTEHHY